ncbi:MAG: type I methionyl aminopeptidase [Kiritimatiellae bacterium]|nr:type I methionyl aminopeptidase [Kiritimatiellia bacterium]
MIIVKSVDELKRMRASGSLAAEVRDLVVKKVGPGVTTLELGEYAGELIKGFGAESAFLGYRGYPGEICVSVNEEVVHGIPGKRQIVLGDIVSVDVGVLYEGFVGDTATTVMVGVTDPDVIQLVRTTEKALEAAIEKACAGRHLSDASSVIEQTAKKAGFTVVRDFVGHGIGRNMHEDPQIPNFGRPGRGPKLKAGMTMCFEPMINMGKSKVEVLDDGWTVVTKDRSMSAHFEHAVAIRDGIAEVLTT